MVKFGVPQSSERLLMIKSDDAVRLEISKLTVAPEYAETIAPEAIVMLPVCFAPLEK